MKMYESDLLLFLTNPIKRSVIIAKVKMVLVEDNHLLVYGIYNLIIFSFELRK